MILTITEVCSTLKLRFYASKDMITAVKEQGTVLELTNKGMGRISKDIELPYCLPGEVVSYDKVIRRHKNDYYLREILKPSLSRKQPICPHFSICGGCALQHLDDATYDNLKRDMVKNAMEAQGITCTIEDFIKVPPGNRRRAYMDVRKKDDRVVLGYHQLRSFYITNIGPCPVLKSDIENLLNPLGILMGKILENSQKATLFLMSTEIGIDLAIDMVVGPADDKKCHLIQFAKDHKLCRIRLRENENIETVCCLEDPYILIDSIPVKTDPWSFVQSSKEAEETLIRWTLEAMPTAYNNIADLFCGRGTLTLPLSNKAKVSGYEMDVSAINALNYASNHAKRKINLTQRNLFLNPLTTKELNDFDGVVINPPRAGAKSQCNELGKSVVKTIIYASCNAETFARDAALLILGGYAIQHLRLLDQFIYTHHIEIFAVFVRSC